MKIFDILKRLEEINKPFYTIADLEKITGFTRKSLYVALNRWVTMGILKKIAQGIYVPFGKEIDVEKIASQMYLPNYLSFESALVRYGILNLIPYTITFATPRKTRNYTIDERDVIFRQIKRDLFWGYTISGGIYVAEKEKAFLDQIYIAKKGIASVDLEEMNMHLLSQNKILKYAKKYPRFVQNYLSSILTK